MTDRYTDTPELPDHTDDEDVTDPDLEEIREVYAAADYHGFDGLTTERILLGRLGVDPDDVVLIPDDSRPTGYRAVTKEEYLGAKEGLAELKEYLSKQLRREYDVPPSEVEKLETLTDYVEARNDARAAQEGGDQG